MSELTSMLWIETRKAWRSGMPLWTGLASLALPLGLAFLIFVARNPELSQQLGLMSAKADLVAYAGTDWPAYLSFFGMFMAMGGLGLFSLVTSWTFGREFADGTVKDLLAVPVARASILLAKFGVTAAWSAGLAVIMCASSLALGALIGLPGATLGGLLMGVGRALVTAALVWATITPFAFLAGVGRGYLLPLGAMMLALVAANLIALVGWADYFPWAVPGLYAMGTATALPVSVALVALTGLAGGLATHRWWTHADQHK
jgi:ABC-2 type transport system permease protein